MMLIEQCVRKPLQASGGVRLKYICKKKIKRLRLTIKNFILCLFGKEDTMHTRAVATEIRWNMRVALNGIFLFNVTP